VREEWEDEDYELSLCEASHKLIYVE